MKTQIIFITLIVLVLIAMPVAAQNSPAGGLAAGNVINRDVDTYMMVNFAPLVNYDKFFSFVQGSFSAVAGSTNFEEPGFSAGFGTKINGSLLHFYLNTKGFSLDKNTVETTDRNGTFEDTYSKNKFNLQFDTAYGNLDIGVFKLGLNFSDIGKEETYSETSDTDYYKKTVQSGFFTPSLAWGKTIIYDNFTMLLYGGTISFRMPINKGNTVEEERIGDVTTTTTSPEPVNTGFPSLPYNASYRLEVSPQMWYFFLPKLEPIVIIPSLYLLNTFSMMFYPEETQRTGTTQAGIADSYISRKHDYWGNTLFGYYNRQYAVAPNFSLAWRLIFTVGVYNSVKNHTFTKVGNGDEVETKVTDEQLFLTAVIAPRFAFGYNIMPARLAINGAVVLNQIGPTNAIGWQFYRDRKIDDDGDTITTGVRNLFNGINPIFTLGTAFNISPFMIVEAGFSFNASRESRFLDEISIGVVYKK